MGNAKAIVVWVIIPIACAMAVGFAFAILTLFRRSSGDWVPTARERMMIEWLHTELVLRPALGLDQRPITLTMTHHPYGISSKDVREQTFPADIEPAESV